MKNNYCVLVLGMHRSGTSAMSKYILDTGFSLGFEPIPAHTTDNPNGYWEARETLSINNKFLLELGSSWKDINPLPAHCFNSKNAQYFRHAIDDLLHTAFTKNNQVVLKDPRICRLLPLWLPLLRKHCQHLAVIFIVRQAEAVHKSLSRRELSKDISAAAISDRPSTFSLWLRYNLEAELYSRSIKRVLVGYEQWLETPAKESRRVFRFLQSEMPGAFLIPAEPQINPGRHTEHLKKVEINDIEDIAHQTYAAILSGDRTCYLDNLRECSNITVPAPHQRELPSPPLEIIARLQIKHICGHIPCEIKTHNDDEKSPPPQKKPIIFISDVPTTRSHLYRVKNAVDALNGAGIEAWWSNSNSIVKHIECMSKACLVVIHRSPWNDNIAKIYSYCNAHKIRTAFDIDDLIFEPALVNSGGIYFISQLKPEDKSKWVAKSQEFRKSLIAADFCIVSTRKIANHLQGKGALATVIPNGFSSETLAVSDYWRQLPKQNTGVRRLGYASGTNTHDADFAVVTEVIATFLERNPEWILTIIGTLDTNACKGLIDDNRIEIRQLVPHVNLSYELARIDINLIPLQRTPFCDAKSALKYYEAALVGVPSIASANPMYANLFGNNENGLIAETSNDWLCHMEFLGNDVKTRSEIAMKARKQCLSLFGPDKTVASFKKVLKDYKLT